MDVLWFAPLAALVLALVVLVLAGRSARRATAQLAAYRPAMTTVRDDLSALVGELVALRGRVDERRGAADPAGADR